MHSGFPISLRASLYEQMAKDLQTSEKNFQLEGEQPYKQQIPRKEGTRRLSDMIMHLGKKKRGFWNSCTIKHLKLYQWLVWKNHASQEVWQKLTAWEKDDYQNVLHGLFWDLKLWPLYVGLNKIFLWLYLEDLVRTGREEWRNPPLI